MRGLRFLLWSPQNTPLRILAKVLLANNHTQTRQNHVLSFITAGRNMSNTLRHEGQETLSVVQERAKWRQGAQEAKHFKTNPGPLLQFPGYCTAAHIVNFKLRPQYL